MKHRSFEKIYGVNERDNGVRMVTFAQANKGRSLEDFAEKASSLSWIKSMSDTEAQCMIAFGCVVLAKLSGISGSRTTRTISSTRACCRFALRHHRVFM